MNNIRINIPQLDKVIKTDQTQHSLLDLFNQEGILIYSPCGGQGTCGKCKVRISGNANDITDEEKNFLSDEEIHKGIRLACKTYVSGEVEVYLLEDNIKNDAKKRIETNKQYRVNSPLTKKITKLDMPTLENSYAMVDCIKNRLGKIKIDISLLKALSQKIAYSKEATFTLYDDELIDVEYKDTCNQKYGVAIDIGTTTVACYLVDLNKGIQMDVSSIQNPQAAYGADVISRINYTIEYEDGLKILSGKIQKAIDELIYTVAFQANVDTRYIYECVLVGNTTMYHLFWGIHPKSLSQLPFNAVTNEMIIKDAELVGLRNMNPRGKILFLPSIGGFVGSDTVGAMIGADMVHQPDNLLLIDLGTNGEIVLATQNGRYACSTAAGPAFEGAKIKYGMQAFRGAINAVKIEEDLCYTTIEDDPARGICGSGLIDVISEFLRVGLIEENGKILDPECIENEKLARRIIKNVRSKEVVIAYEEETENHEAIVITQKDIRELQLAKGAIKAGINILLKVANLKFENIDKILLAGAFGNFINKESARRIGIFPNIPLDKIISLGNAAGEGAKRVLCDQGMIETQANVYATTTKHIEISTHPDFQQEFLEGMYLR